MWLQTSCELIFDVEIPTPFVLMLRLRSGAQQWIANEEYIIEPSVPATEFTDDFGNLCQRLVAPPGNFRIFTTARINIPDIIDTAPGGEFVDIVNLPDDVMKYLLPSRYCESDRFGVMATKIAANHNLGYDQVEAIESWMKENISYLPGSSFYPQSAIEVHQQQSGVCRDLAHLGIALCRSLSIPARMVVGYLHGLKPMELHAWFEAFVAGRWYTFDATQEAKQGAYAVIGYGRDAADVAMYNQFGPGLIPTAQIVTVKKV